MNERTGRSFIVSVTEPLLILPPTSLHFLCTLGLRSCSLACEKSPLYPVFKAECLEECGEGRRCLVAMAMGHGHVDAGRGE